MWIMTPGGFVSVVQKPWDRAADTLTIRSRDKESLAEFLAAARQWDITLPQARELIPAPTLDSDYPFRVVLSRAEVHAAMDCLVDEITYENFKNKAHAVRKGKKDQYGSFLMRVWTAGLMLEPKKLKKTWGKPAASAGKHGPDEAPMDQQTGSELWQSVHAMSDQEWDEFQAKHGGV